MIPIVLVINGTGMSSYQARPMSEGNKLSVKYPLGNTSVQWTADLGNTMMPPQLYSENGCYYLYIKDLSKFKHEDNEKISLFYKKIIEAENCRKRLLTTFDMQGSNKIQTEEQFTIYMEMRIDIIQAAVIESEVCSCLQNE